MKFARVLFLFLGLAGMAILRVHAADPVGASSAHLALLADFRAEHERSLLKGDPTIIAGYFDAEVRLMPEFQRTVLGRDHALGYYQALLARFTVEACRREVIDVLDLGPRLVETGRFTQRLVGKGREPTYDLNGKYVDIWTKAADGTLRLVAQAWNYSHQVEQGDALRFAEVPAVVAAFQRRVPVTNSISLELAALCQLIEASVIQHDGPVFSRLFADDAILLPNFDRTYQGRAAIDAYVAEHFQHLPVFEKLDIRNDRIDAFTGYVIEYASHIASWRNGDYAGVGTGKNLRIWRREPDHSLKLIRQIGMYDY